MTSGQFEKIVAERVQTIWTTLKIKGEEYSDEEDRLENFKQAGKLQQSSPEQALLGFVAKHVVAIYSFADTDATAEQWEEKITDIINYMILLDALLQERGAK